MAVLTVVDFQLRGVVGYAVLVVVVLDGGADGFLGENGAVYLVRGQTVESLHNGLVGQGECLLDRLALDELGRHGAGGYRAAAAEGVKFAVGDDAVVVDLDIHTHDVAALGVADFTYTVSIVDFADVAGILKMIHYLIAVKCHCYISFSKSKYYNYYLDQMLALALFKLIPYGGHVAQILNHLGDSGNNVIYLLHGVVLAD